MELTLALDRSSSETLQNQVFNQIRELILSGGLQPEMMLPPSRYLAESMSVSRNTVMLAYDRLVAEGYVKSRGTSGTFVSSVLPDELLNVRSLRACDGTSSKMPKEEVRGMPSPLLCFAGYPAGPHLPRSGRPAYDFWVGRSEPSTFPVKHWRRLLLRKLASAGSNLTEYGDPAGLEELRIAIASHLERSRGMSVAMEQVIVTGGSQDGLSLICRLFDQRTHPFFVENPCYQGAAYLFQSVASQVYPVPVDHQGIIVDRLPFDKSGVVFVTPSHQYPTGTTLSLRRRLYLLQWAEQTNSFIIEDDYDSDFRYDGPPLTSLAGLDRSRRVLYLGTFSKSIGAGLRIGYAVVPRELAEAARVVKSQMNSGEPWLNQAVLAEFITSGLLDQHLRRVRQLYKRRRDCLKSSLMQRFGEIELYGADAGLHMVWRLPCGSPPVDVLQSAARQRGLGVYALHNGGAYDFDGSSRQDLVVLGYSSLKEEDIEKAIEILHQVIERFSHSSSEGRMDMPSRPDGVGQTMRSTQLKKVSQKKGHGAKVVVAG